MSFFFTRRIKREERMNVLILIERIYNKHKEKTTWYSNHLARVSQAKIKQIISKKSKRSGHAYLFNEASKPCTTRAAIFIEAYRARNKPDRSHYSKSCIYVNTIVQTNPIPTAFKIKSCSFAYQLYIYQRSAYCQN